MRSIRSINILSKGKNRDMYGNPYHAFRADIVYSYVSYFKTISISMTETYGDSGEYDCLKWALQGIKEAIGENISPNDPRIQHTHKHVGIGTDMGDPLNWKMPTYNKE